MAKWSSQHNGKFPDPYSKLKLDEEKKLKKKKKKKDKNRDRDSILSQIDPNANKVRRTDSDQNGGRRRRWWWKMLVCGPKLLREEGDVSSKKAVDLIDWQTFWGRGGNYCNRGSSSSSRFLSLHTSKKNACHTSVRLSVAKYLRCPKCYLAPSISSCSCDNFQKSIFTLCFIFVIKRKESPEEPSCLKIHRLHPL